jgi:hypothetical protein
MERIKKYGISRWHRLSFSTCKNQPINPDTFYLSSESNDANEDASAR